MKFIRTLIRLITGRISFERRAAMMAIGHATEEEWLHVFGDAKMAAYNIQYFLLTGEFL